VEWSARITNGVVRHLGITWEVLPRSKAPLKGISGFDPALVCILDCDQGIKFCSKIQSARNRFKPDESVGLVVANPTQLVSSQTDVGSERYCNLFVKSNRQKKMMLTVQSVQADVAGPYRPYDDVASDDVAESGWLLKVNDV
jgi:hypothetical protein